MIEFSLRIFSVLINIYIMMIFLRVIISWIHGSVSLQHGALGMLCRLVDPYLFFFRRFRWMRIGAIDLSPMVAVGVLYFFQNFVITILGGGSVSLSAVARALIGLFFNIFQAIVGLLILLIIIRLILLSMNSYSNTPLTAGLDSILRPIISRLIGSFSSRPIRFKTSLLISVIILGVIYVALSFLGTSLINFL